MSHPTSSSHLPSIQLHLNSLYASLLADSTKRSHAWFVLNEGISIPRTHQFYISLCEVAIPVSWYVINYTNNVINYTYDDIQHTIIIEPGNYTALSLAEYINASHDHFNLTYNLKTYKFNVEPLNNKLLQFADGAKILSIQPQNVGTDQPFTSDVVDLGGTRSVFVKTNLGTQCMDSFHKGRSNILAKIPVLVENGQILQYNASSFKTSIADSHINVLEIFLLDEQHNELNLNGLDWSLTLQFDVIEKPLETLRMDKNVASLTEYVINQQNTVA